MRIKVKIHPSSSQEKVEKKDDKLYEVWLREKPVDNKANDRLLKILKKHFKRNVEIVKGLKSKEKLIEIAGGYPLCKTPQRK